MEYFNKIKDAVNSYVGTEVEQTILEVTSMDSWGASNTLKQKIASYTNQYDTLEEVKEVLFKRLDHEAPIVILKTLQLMQFLLIHGSPRIVQAINHHKHTIGRYQSYSWNDGVKDYSNSIREASKDILRLLQDPEELQSKRNEEKGQISYGSVSNQGGGFGGGSYGGQGSNSYSSNSYSGNSYSSNTNNGSKYGGMGGGSSNHGGNSYSANNGSKYGGMGGGSQPQPRQPSQQHNNNGFNDNNDDPYTAKPTATAQKTTTTTTTTQSAQQRRTIGQAATHNPLSLQKPHVQEKQPPAQHIDEFTSGHQNDPFADDSKIVVTQTTDDPFAEAAGEFDAFDQDNSTTVAPAAQPTQQPAPAVVVEPVKTNANDDVFALLGSTSTTNGNNNNSGNSIMSLYDKPVTNNTNAFDALYATPAQQPQQQQQQPMSMQQNMFGQQQQHQPQFQQQQHNPYDFSSPYSFNAQPQQQQQKPQQVNNSADPFADIFASSNTTTATVPRQQQQSTAASVPAAKKDDPFDFGF